MPYAMWRRRVNAACTAVPAAVASANSHAIAPMLGPVLVSGLFCDCCVLGAGVGAGVGLGVGAGVGFGADGVDWPFLLVELPELFEPLVGLGCFELFVACCWLEADLLAVWVEWCVSACTAHTTPQTRSANAIASATMRIIQRSTPELLDS